MKCLKCESEWISKTSVVKNCPFCGADLYYETAEDGNKVFDNTAEALAYIYKKHGTEILLSEKLSSYLTDYVPDMSVSVKRLMKYFYDVGAAELIKNSINGSEEDKLEAVKKTISRLTENFIDLQMAESITYEFSDALGWKINRFFETSLPTGIANHESKGDNMNQIETANRFIDVMLDAEETLAGVKQKIDERKAKAQNLIIQFAEKQKQIIDGEREKIVSENSLAIFEYYRKVLNNAVEKQKNDHTEYIKGQKFIDKFEETFIVSVFGKVKSGKSYLGNYIMGTSYKKNNILTNYDKLGNIEVTVYDKGKLSTGNALSVSTDESDGQGFGVASTEATSTIQYCKIGGLTWFETPGIGSVVKENEQLAEEYIKNSDLVVFAINSDSAGVLGELSELKELYEMNKPMMILVTMSDEYDYDIDNEGNIFGVIKPKSDKDRKDVENYLINEIKFKGMDKALELSGGNVLTISTKLAMEALENNCNVEMYEGSNMDLFINRLIDITKGEAAELKERNPKDRFNKFISELEKSVNNLEKEVKDLNAKASVIREKAEDVKKRVISEVKYHATTIIHDKVQETSFKLKGSQPNISGKQIAAEVSDAINSIIQRECSSGFVELIPDISYRLSGNVLDSDSMNISDMGTKKVTSSYEVEVVTRKKVERGMFGKIGNFLFGEKYVTRTVEFEVGDNSVDIEIQLQNYFEDICKNTWEKMIQDLVVGCVKPFETIYKKFQILTDSMRKELKSLKIK